MNEESIKIVEDGENILIVKRGNVYFRAFLYEDNITDELNEKVTPQCPECGHDL